MIETNAGKVTQISNSEKPIVIVGCQRSGTTLLRTILGRHPQLLEHPQEPQFILELYERFGYEVRDVRTAVAYLLKHPYLPKNITPAALQQAYAPHRQLSLHHFFQIYLYVWAGEKLFTRRPILKHPALIYHLDLVTRLFPQATIVHIIRDPRGCVSSQKIRWAHLTTWESTMLWKKAVQSGKKWADNHGAPLQEVSYERVVLHPEEEVTSLCRRLTVPFLPELLTFDEETTGYTLDARPQQVKYKTVDASRLYQWKEWLSPLEIRLIEHGCKTKMVERGYELSLPLVPCQQFYLQLYYERLHFIVKANGRRVKNILRRAGWRFGLRLLQVPPK